MASRPFVNPTQLYRLSVRLILYSAVLLRIISFMLLISLLVACAVFGLGLATDRVVHTELKESVVQELLKCINALSIDYRVYVDADGQVVVIPAGRRTIDLRGVDKGLATCMLQVLGEMTVAAESSEFGSPSHQSALATGSADFAFLLENSAKGQRPLPGNATALVDRSEHRLTKRCAGYYGAYLDIDAGCDNADCPRIIRNMCELRE